MTVAVRETKLGDIAEVAAGQGAPQGASNFGSVGHPFVRAGSLDVLNGGASEGKLERIANHIASDHGLRLFPAGTVIFAKSGMSAVKGLVYQLRQSCYVVSHLAAVVPKAVLDSSYIRHWFLAHPPSRLINDSAYPSIRLPDIAALSIPLPSLAEQQRIAAVLDKADGIRRKRRESLRLLDEFLQSAYMYLVGQRNDDYVTWPDLSVADLASSPEAIRTGPFGSSLRHSEFVDRGIAVLGIDNAVQNRFAWGERRFITEEKYQQFKRYTVKPGDIIITIMGTTGRSAVVPDNIPPAISTKHLAVITLDRPRVQPQYLAHAIHSDPAVLAQISGANRGAIMSGLNLGLIKRLRLRLPPVTLQEQFARVVAVASSAREQLMLAGTETDRLYDSLAQRAFRGEL